MRVSVAEILSSSNGSPGRTGIASPSAAGPKRSSSAESTLGSSGPASASLRATRPNRHRCAAPPSAYFRPPTIVRRHVYPE